MDIVFNLAVLSFVFIVNAQFYNDYRWKIPEDYKIKKRQYNPKLRFLITAGLDGSGQNLIEQFFSSDLCTVCKIETEFSRLLLHYKKDTQLVHGLFSGADASKPFEMIRNVEQGVKTLIEKYQNQDALVLIKHPGIGGKMTYPSHNAKHRAVDHPDVRLFCMILERMGADCRVVVLQRSAHGILNSVGGYGGAAQPKVLNDNMLGLYGQLTLMDREFFFCLPIQYFNIRDEQYANKLQETTKFGKFLHPAILPVIHKMTNRTHNEAFKIEPRVNDLLRELKNNFPVTIVENITLGSVTEIFDSEKAFLEYELGSKVALINSECNKNDRLRIDQEFEHFGV